jgi:hypothetical protein
MKNKETDNEQQSLFDLADEKDIDLRDHTLRIVNAEMTGTDSRTWQELFDGYDELYVITFSSGIDFTAQLISRFEYAEIVYGCEIILPTGVAAAISVEQTMVKLIAKCKAAETIAARMSDRTLSLYVADDTRSHEKIFCLRSKSGRTRVITGSANMSSTAFMGVQRENILCFDDEKAFAYYFDLFEKYRDTCAQSISYKLIAKAIEDPSAVTDDIEELPFVEKIKKESIVYLEPQRTPSEEDEAEIIAEIKGHEAELRTVLPQPHKDGNKVYLTSEDIKYVKRNI